MSTDVSLAGVRIIQIGDTTLFVPIDWLDGYLIDDIKSDAATSSGRLEPLLGRIAPDLHRIECPGTVHRFAVGERTSSYGALAFRVGGLPAAIPFLPDRQINPTQVIVKARAGGPPSTAASRPTFAGSSSAERWIQVPDRPMVYALSGDSAEGACTAQRGSIGSEWVVSRWITQTVGIGFVVEAETSLPLPEWAPLCRSMEPLFAWLATTPSSRDGQN